MACAPCTTPVTSSTSLPVSSKHPAYISESPTCTTTVSYENPSGCGTLVQNPNFASGCATNKWNSTYQPGWVPRLTGFFKGRLVVACGAALGFLRGRAGLVGFDGERVSSEPLAKLPFGTGDDSLVNDGMIPLVQIGKDIWVDENGTAQESEVHKLGFQQLGNSAVLEMAGFSIDCIKGTVRHDVVKPIERDLIKKGWLSGFRRLGFRIRSVDTDGCCVKEIPEWYNYSGAVFGADEIKADQSSGMVPTLVAVNNDGETAYVLSYRSIATVSEQVAEADASETYYVARTVQKDGDGKVIGYTEKHVPVPFALQEEQQAFLEGLEARIDVLEAP